MAVTVEEVLTSKKKKERATGCRVSGFLNGSSMNCLSAAKMSKSSEMRRDSSEKPLTNAQSIRELQDSRGNMIALFIVLEGTLCTYLSMTSFCNVSFSSHFSVSLVPQKLRCLSPTLSEIQEISLWVLEKRRTPQFFRLEWLLGSSRCIRNDKAPRHSASESNSPTAIMLEAFQQIRLKRQCMLQVCRLLHLSMIWACQ